MTTPPAKSVRVLYEDDAVGFVEAPSFEEIVEDAIDPDTCKVNWDAVWEDIYPLDPTDPPANEGAD